MKTFAFRSFGFAALSVALLIMLRLERLLSQFGFHQKRNDGDVKSPGCIVGQG
jgi:hypothetical protein